MNEESTMRDRHPVQGTFGAVRCKRCGGVDFDRVVEIHAAAGIDRTYWECRACKAVVFEFEVKSKKGGV